MTEPAVTGSVLAEWERGNVYWLSIDGAPWTEVSEDDWTAAEQRAGFRPSGPWKRATDGFLAAGIEGRVTRKGEPMPGDPLD